jgi:hypothetical protein
MYGKVLDWSITVNYLGVTLDRILQWTTHIFKNHEKAKRQPFMYKQLVGQHFGPQPQYMRWMYMEIVHLSLSYGAVVWWCMANLEQILRMLTQLSRLAMMTLGPLLRSMLTSGLEMMGISPHGPLLTRRSGQNMDPNKEYS